MRRREFNRRAFALSLGILLFALSFVVQAQQPATIPRIGWLTLSSSSTNSRNIEAFLNSMRALGYVERKNIEISFRYADGQSERLSDLGAELVRLKVAVIVTSGTEATKVVQRATTEIPIVVASAGDLVGEGIVTSLARPGGNVTGLTALSPDLSGKRLELLKETVPKATRVAVLWHRNVNDEKEVKATEVAASGLGVQLQSLPVQSGDGFQNA